MRKTKESQIKASEKYDKNNTKGLYLKFNIHTDKDILEFLNKSNNKQGYIKDLIRADMEKIKK